MIKHTAISHERLSSTKHKISGFTLLEMMVSIGIFSVVIISAIAVLISISRAQEKASIIQNIQDNVRYTVEFMSKEMRQGKEYNPGNCGAILDAGSGVQRCSKIQFTSSLGASVWYCFADGAVKRLEDAADSCEADGVPVTAPDFTVSYFDLYVAGAAAGSADGQPRVTIVLAGKSNSPQAALETNFKIQTTVTQRVRDYD